MTLKNMKKFLILREEHKNTLAKVKIDQIMLIFLFFRMISGFLLFGILAHCSSSEGSSKMYKLPASFDLEDFIDLLQSFSEGPVKIETVNVYERNPDSESVQIPVDTPVMVIGSGIEYNGIKGVVLAYLDGSHFVKLENDKTRLIANENLVQLIQVDYETRNEQGEMLIKQGTVESFSEKSLEYVIKTSEDEDELISIDQLRLPENTVVRLVHLGRRADLNGQLGKIHRIWENGKYQVQMEDELVSVSFANIRI
jgi:hypothetical protein